MGAAAGGIAIGIAPWLAIVLVCLALIALIVAVTLAVKTIKAEFKRKPGLDDMKPLWGKEALILDIQDAEWHLEKEERLERPITPAETLEGMSEEELRHLLNEIGKKVVPPIDSWPLLVLAGLGVLGVGGVAAYAMSKRKPKE